MSDEFKVTLSREFPEQTVFVGIALDTQGKRHIILVEQETPNYSDPVLSVQVMNEPRVRHRHGPEFSQAYGNASHWTTQALTALPTAPAILSIDNDRNLVFKGKVLGKNVGFGSFLSWRLPMSHVEFADMDNADTRSCRSRNINRGIRPRDMPRAGLA